MDYYYVFYKNLGYNMYERTCGTKERAEEKKKELEDIYGHSEYFKNDIPKSYKWAY